MRCVAGGLIRSEAGESPLLRVRPSREVDEAMRVAARERQGIARGLGESGARRRRPSDRLTVNPDRRRRGLSGGVVTTGAANTQSAVAGVATVTANNAMHDTLSVKKGAPHQARRDQAGRATS